MDAVCSKIFEIVVKNSHIKAREDSIGLQTDLINDLGYGSIQLIQLISEIEDELGFDFDEEDLQLDAIRSVKRIVEIAYKKLGL